MTHGLEGESASGCDNFTTSRSQPVRVRAVQLTWLIVGCGLWILLMLLVVALCVAARKADDNLALEGERLEQVRRGVERPAHTPLAPASSIERTA